MGRKRRLAEVSGHELSNTLLGTAVLMTLDLHGLTTVVAERKVRDFVLTCSRSASGQVVRIITGKGLGSEQGPVLIPLVQKLLETSLASYVAQWTMEAGGYLVRIK